MTAGDAVIVDEKVFKTSISQDNIVRLPDIEVFLFIKFVIIAQSVAVKKYDKIKQAGIKSFAFVEQIKAAVKAFQLIPL